ncbi:hypothetical protein DV096_15975 [Bradymonadaceae bacterium TMQ3]|uniref:Fimbrial assembly protein n=1 Tax=Lujinxingia sediminis TaxID=2480984 RepID=A0ABY0CQW3_9DELT|nr:PilN domain-containing protein [Lujinxingia sediminis]RDV37009.1 hypothetical protein DV096_15975 [Bradymonadaceae bacterium TMQ3]RVU42911.1 hypothetical protein EA187_13825 [Lujinxingia sediminis]TXC73132.1 hypothetical protein FRC91_16915 [Bradymonadales bacterium TMQ1]
MIRVNLLPIKQARRRSAGRTQLLLFAGLLIAELAILFVFYLVESEKLSTRESEVTGLQREVTALESEVADARTLEKEAEALNAQLAVLNNLEAQRIGPVRMLDEIQAMLSPPRNEEERVAQLRKDWNVEWDTRRLWVESFSEGEGAFELEGMAGSADDVAEFLQRMTTARHFANVQLEYVETASGGGRSASGQVRMVNFRIFGELSYLGYASASEADAEQGS